MSDDTLAVLQRWEDSGAIWRITGRGPDGLDIDLVTCTGDEVVDRLRSSDPALLAYVGDRTASDD